MKSRSSVRTSISPVVAVLLLVFVSVALSVGVYVLLEDSVPPQSHSLGYSSFSMTEDSYEAMLVDAGGAVSYTYTVNGESVYTVTDPAAHIGDRILLNRYTQLCAGDSVSVVGTRDGSRTVLQTAVVDQDINCDASDTQSSATASYDGVSWIVSVSLTNTGSQTQEYTIVLTDGDTYEPATTITLSPGESHTLKTSTDSFDETAPPLVGVIHPSDGTGEYVLGGGSLGGGGTTAGYMGGPSAGSSFYQPYSPDATTGTTGTDSQVVESSPGEPDIGLSTNRVFPGGEVKLYASLSTAKSSTTETLIVQATKTSGTDRAETIQLSSSEYALSSGSITKAVESFSFAESGEYLITAAIRGSDEIHTAGTITVSAADAVSVSSSSVSPDDPRVGDTLDLAGTLQNDGTTDATVTVQFFETGEVIHEDVVTVPAGETISVGTQYDATEERLHQFHLGVMEPAVVSHLGDYYVSANSRVSATTSSSPTYPTPGETVSFSASGSHENGNPIVEYKWNFGDGATTTTTEGSATHSYEESGVYTYTVTAIADTGEQTTTGGAVLVKIDSGTVSCDESTTKVFNEDTTVAAGTYEYNCLVVQTGVVVTVEGNTTADMNPGEYGGVQFNVAGDVHIDGEITATGQGHPASEGPGQTADDDNQQSGGAGYGGKGGEGSCNDNPGPCIGPTYGSPDQALRLGSGAGNPARTVGGAGGGSVWIISDGTVFVNGTIRADGTKGGNDPDHRGYDGGGGGSGGSIRIETETLAGDGLLAANGGEGGNDRGNGGGGGRILLNYGTDESALSVERKGGARTGSYSHNGEPGTLRRNP